MISKPRIEQSAAPRCADADLFKGVGQKQADVVVDQVAPRETSTLGFAEKREEVPLLVKEVEAKGPARVQEVRVLVLQHQELANGRQLCLEGQQRAAAKKIVLRDLCLRDEVFNGRETGTNLKGTSLTLGNFYVYKHLVVAAATGGGHIGAFKEAQRGYPAL